MVGDEKKRIAARAALELVEPDSVVGVGSGSTTNHFIDALGEIRDRVAGAVASSKASAERLERHGIRLVDLNAAPNLALYVDGADEATRRCELVKGGGGALTREKIIAAAARRFVCILDDGKLVERLGAFPLPVEVIPLARGHVTEQLSRLAGRAVWREGFTTDKLGDRVQGLIYVPGRRVRHIELVVEAS